MALCPLPWCFRSFTPLILGRGAVRHKICTGLQHSAEVLAEAHGQRKEEWSDRASVCEMGRFSEAARPKCD